MARFLITVWPLAGHLYPNLALATALRERGHEVAFYTSARAGATVEREGFACLPFQAVDGDGFEAMMASGYATLPAWARWRKQKELYRAWLVDTLPAQLADLEAALDRWRPDAIVCDPTMWAPILVLHERRRIPVAVFSYTVGCLLPGPETPPAGPGLPSPRTWRARWVCRALRRADAPGDPGHPSRGQRHPSSAWAGRTARHGHRARRDDAALSGDQLAGAGL
jgi:hypothetical protein